MIVAKFSFKRTLYVWNIQALSTLFILLNNMKSVLRGAYFKKKLPSDTLIYSDQ